jgi:hypothetical protein
MLRCRYVLEANADGSHAKSNDTFSVMHTHHAYILHTCICSFFDERMHEKSRNLKMKRPDFLVSTSPSSMTSSVSRKNWQIATDIFLPCQHKLGFIAKSHRSIRDCYSALSVCRVGKFRDDLGMSIHTSENGEDKYHLVFLDIQEFTSIQGYNQQKQELKPNRIHRRDICS